MKAQRDHVTCTGSHGLGIGVQDSTARLPPPTSSQGYTGFDEESLRSKGVGLPPQLNSTQVLWAHAETVNANALSRCFSLSLVHWDPELDPPPTGPRRGQRLVPQPPAPPKLPLLPEFSQAKPQSCWQLEPWGRG